MANNRVYKTGDYKLINPGKYKGSKAPKYKSSFEERIFWWCDVNENIIEWSYEAYPIQYIFEGDRTWTDYEKSLADRISHRYYPDIFIKVKDNQDKFINYILEIKPYSQTVKPVEPKKKTKKALAKYENALTEFLKNAKKWEAAEKFSKERGMVFKVLTERNLFT